MIDNLKAGAAQATTRARTSMQESTLAREVAQAYGDLGRAAFELMSDGALRDARLTAGVERIRSLEAQLAALTESDRVMSKSSDAVDRREKR